MGDYDQAERYAIKRIDPAGFLRWLLVGLDSDLVFARWLETQLTPFPGEPDRRPDCVAELVSHSGTQAPWACLIEPQGQEQADFVVRVVQYLLILHTELRTGWRERDRYQLMAGIVNVCEGHLQSEIAWRPPGVVGVGLTAGCWVRKVYDEPAAATLEAIAAGRVARCLLPWVPAMDGGDRAEVIARWRTLTEQETDRSLRATYVGLAFVFAEKRQRGEVWRTGLEGWNVGESQIINEWRAEGYNQALAIGLEGARALLLSMLRVRFGTSLPASLVERIKAEQGIDKLSACGRIAETAPLDEVEAFFSSANGAASR